MPRQVKGNEINDLIPERCPSCGSTGAKVIHGSKSFEVVGYLENGSLEVEGIPEGDADTISFFDIMWWECSECNYEEHIDDIFEYSTE